MTRDTSKEAFFEGEDDGTHVTQRDRIKRCFDANPGASMHAGQIFDWIKVRFPGAKRPDSDVTPRMPELVADGVLRENGEVIDDNGRRRIQWCLGDGTPRKRKMTRPQIGLALFNQAIADAEALAPKSLFDVGEKQDTATVKALKKLKEECQSWKVIAPDEDAGDVAPPVLPESPNGKHPGGQTKPPESEWPI